MDLGFDRFYVIQALKLLDGDEEQAAAFNVFKASLWRRLIGKALQAGRLGGRLASDWYGVRLTTMASGSRRFGVRFVEIEQGGRHTGMATVGKRGHGRKDGESAGARESIARAGD